MTVGQGDLQCCNKSYGVYTATISAVGAQSLVREFNMIEIPKRNSEMQACEDEEECKCAQTTSTPSIDPQTSESDATTPGIVAGVGFIVLIVAVLAVVVLILWFK